VVLVCPGVESITLEQYYQRIRDKIRKEESSEFPTNSASIPRAEFETNAAKCSSEQLKQVPHSTVDYSNESRSISEGVELGLDHTVYDHRLSSEEASIKEKRKSGSLNSELTGGPDVVVYIDCTWHQVHGMLADPRLAG